MATLRKVIITCNHRGQSANRTVPWDEEYTEAAEVNGFPYGHANPEQWGRALVKKFNDTLQPGERPRDVLGVRVVELTADEAAKVPIAHDWEKTNAVTIYKRGQLYDTAKCRRCGVTAKRFGVGRHVVDPKWKKRGASCALPKGDSDGK